MKPVLAYCFSVLWLAAGASQPASGQPGAVRGDSLAGQRTVYTVFLVGDAGAATPPPGTVPASLAGQLEAAGPKASVVWLGNHAGCKGFSHADDSGERETPPGMPSLAALKNFPGRVVIIPGNCDWDDGRRDGWRAVQRQEQSVERYLDRGNVFLPGGGCPGPVEVPLSEQVTLVVLDTQWWLHPWDKPGEESDCEAKEAMEVSLQLDDILARNRHKRVIVAGHHPLYSYGRRGGYRPARVHLFPLTDLHPALYVPLPGLGSGYALYHRLLGGPQDIPHPRYLVQRNALRDVLNKYPGVVYAAGHDEALQYIRRGGVHYVNSGTPARDPYLAPGKRDLQYGRAGGGFARLDYQAGGDVWLSLWPAEPGGKGPLYREKLPGGPPEPPLARPEPGGYSGDSLVTRPASDLYGASRFKTRLLGSNYRSEWEQPVTMPVFDIGHEKGGLTILKMGGGMQTKSLRLQAPDCRQYVLRSVDKRTQAVLPQSLRGTLADDLLQDQISASHPYGALAVPGLAAAAGVYASRPELVFVPDDPRLGKYQALFANTVAMLEERPEETGEDNPEEAQKVYSTTKMLARL
ncbi:MAG: metallophosphoesterase, partial [Cytophagales bacterium]|nr:metallophosphoesterase [Cytophagales bacterium]